MRLPKQLILTPPLLIHLSRYKKVAPHIQLFLITDPNLHSNTKANSQRISKLATIREAPIIQQRSQPSRAKTVNTFIDFVIQCLVKFNVFFYLSITA